MESRGRGSDLARSHTAPFRRIPVRSRNLQEGKPYEPVLALESSQQVPTPMTWQLVLKVLLTAVVVVAVSEIAKRNSFWGAVLASLPLTSLLAFVWIYLDTRDVNAVATLSHGIFWLVLASLPLFLVLPFLIHSGWNFWLSLAVSCALTAGAYFALGWLLARAGVQL